MSAESMAWALNLPDLTPSQKLVLIGIANHDGDGGAWPSVATLARYACLKRRRVQQVIAELEQLGLITRMVQHGGGGFIKRDEQRPNLYILHRRPVPHNLSIGVQPSAPHPRAARCTPRVQPSAPKPSNNLASGTGSSTSSRACTHSFVSADTGECPVCDPGSDHAQ